MTHTSLPDSSSIVFLDFHVPYSQADGSQLFISQLREFKKKKSLVSHQVVIFDFPRLYMLLSCLPQEI